MYTIISATIKLDLNEFNFDFDSGYIDGSDQWLTPTEEGYIGACTTIHKALDIVDRTVYVHLDSNRKNLILEYTYISGEDGCIKHLEFANFEGKIYEIDNDLYCPELAQILNDKILDIMKQQFLDNYNYCADGLKHRYSIELSTRGFKAKGLDWAVEQALKNDDSHIIENSDGGIDVDLGDGMTCDVCDGDIKTVIFLYIECERYIVVDHGEAVYSTDYLSDAFDRVDNSCQFVYDWKDKLFM